MTKLECVGGPYDGEWLPDDREFYRIVSSQDEDEELGEYRRMPNCWYWVRTNSEPENVDPHLGDFAL